MIVNGCTKSQVQPPVEIPPEMKYIDLRGSAISFHQFASYDLDGNGEKDIKFSTLLAGDAINQLDKRQWLVSTYFYSSLPVDNTERIPVLIVRDTIRVKNFNSYNWYNVSSIILAEKIIGMQDPPYWRGDWKEAAHQFIPVLVKKNDSLYAGWIEISFDRNLEQLILHRAAICRETDRNVMAGI
jgi:hypothetical protein